MRFETGARRSSWQAENRPTAERAFDDGPFRVDDECNPATDHSPNRLAYRSFLTSLFCRGFVGKRLLNRGGHLGD